MKYLAQARGLRHVRRSLEEQARIHAVAGDDELPRAHQV
jgi:hypothetical protein